MTNTRWPGCSRPTSVSACRAGVAIYHHVPSKDAILDGIVDRVFAEITPPPLDLDWRDALRVRCVSAREVLNRHPWAPPLMESRTSPGPATLHHHDAVLGCLRRGGLPWSLTAHAYAILDSFVYGFALQEANLPFDDEEQVGELSESIIQPLSPDELPQPGRLHHRARAAARLRLRAVVRVRPRPPARRHRRGHHVRHGRVRRFWHNWSGTSHR